MDAMDDAAPPTQFAGPPSPPSERGAWVLAGALALLGVLALAAALTGVVAGGSSSSAAPPRLLIARVATPAPAPAGSHAAGGPGAGAAAGRLIVETPTLEEQALDARRFTSATHTHISQGWVEAFYPIYAKAQSTFGVDWLLIASIHAQETAFSTATSTYHGLNFAHCCAGPMQFNVTNGPVTTWDLVADSYRYGRRPASYDHATARHPSVYDDFDAVMAAAHLLSADGAGVPLDKSAWWAAYDYYGHDSTGVLYADQVLARAIGWSQHGFCANCAVNAELVQATDAAYGAPVLAALEEEERRLAAEERAHPAKAHRHAAHGSQGRSKRRPSRAASQQQRMPGQQALEAL